MLFNDEWVDYSYWEFAKYLMRSANTGVSMNLKSALLYSHAYADDNDDVYIVTDTVMAAEILKAEKETVLTYLRETDDIERSQLEVLVANDL